MGLVYGRGMSGYIVRLIIKEEKEFSVLNAIYLGPLSGAGTSGPNRIGQSILTDNGECN